MVHGSFAGREARDGGQVLPPGARRGVTARSHGAGGLGNGDKFLAAAADNARSDPNEAEMPPPEKAGPSDYTEWILLGRLDAVIQRTQ